MKNLLPEEFQTRIRGQQYIDHELLIRALNAPSPVSIRINPVKWTKNPEHTDKVTWCENGFYLPERPSFTLDPLFHAGCYYPQEASSMFLEQVFKQTCSGIKNIKVLDLCGAPGGKSTHLSTLIGEDGFLVANEVIRQRSFVLAENLTKWGLSNFVVTQSDPSAFGRLGSFFDLIVADAPCSGEGMFCEKAVRDEWSQGNCALCSDRQKRILTGSWPALKDNGVLIYSTCTFNPAENEENMSWFITHNDAESVKIDISEYPGIAEIHYNGIYGYGFYPGKITGEGFFISVIRKKSGETNSLKAARLFNTKISNEEKSRVAHLTTFGEDKIVKTGDEIYAIPCSQNELDIISGELKIIQPGTSVFTRKGKDYLTSHEIALSVRFKKDKFSMVDLDQKQALSYLRRDNFKIHCPEKGWNLVTYKGVNLGFINNIGTRFNNYYPVEWRIRMRLSGDAPESTIKWIRTNK